MTHYIGRETFVSVLLSEITLNIGAQWILVKRINVTMVSLKQYQMPETNRTFQGDISVDGMKCFRWKFKNLSVEIALLSTALRPLDF